MHTAETYNSAFQIHIWKRKTNRLHNFMNADIRSRDFGKKNNKTQICSYWVQGFLLL